MLFISEVKEEISVLEVMDLTKLEDLILFQCLQALISRDTLI